MRNNNFKKKRDLKIFCTVILMGAFTMYPATGKETVPLDFSLRKSKLPNGLTYYIKPIKDESTEINISLILKAGSAVENQYEFAHFMEHMAFKSGENMTISKANNLGFEIGQINGTASYNFTRFQFKSVSTEKQRDVAFQLLQDIIWNLNMTNENIQSERAVVINEKMERGGYQANSLMNDYESAMIGRGAIRPKNFETHIENFPRELLEIFYKDWYRTDLMAIVVVGDINDINSIENEIIERFSAPNPNKSSQNPINNYEEYRNSPPKYICKAHPYLNQNSKDDAVYIRLYMRQKKHQKVNGMDALWNEHKRRLFINMLRKRLIKQQQQQYATTFYVLPEFILPSSLGLALHLRIENGSKKQVVKELIKCLKQLKLNGFLNQEFNKGKKEYLNSLVKNVDKGTSYWKDRILDHFIYEKSLSPNINNILTKMINELTLTDFNEFIEQFIKIEPNDLDIIVLAPQGDEMIHYSEKEFRSWIEESNNHPPLMLEKRNIPEHLLSEQTIQNLRNTTIKVKTSNPYIKEYQLENGVKIILKPFDSLVSLNNEEQKLSFLGYVSKGISYYPEKDYYSALNSAEIVMNSGVNGMNKFELIRYLADKEINLRVSPYIKYNEAGIKGEVSLLDLETALQLVYLYLTSANKDSLAFKDWQMRNKSSLVMKTINEDAFRAKIREVLGDYTIFPDNHNPLKSLTQTDMNRAFEIYKDIFKNAQNFTFIFTGDFEVSKVLSLCRIYLGNLPVIKKEKIKPARIHPKKKLPQAGSITMPSPEYMKQTKVKLVYVTPLDKNSLDWKGELKLKLLQQLMSYSIMQNIRMNSIQEQQTYYIGLYCNLEKSRIFNEVFVEFSSKLEHSDFLTKKAISFIKSFSNDSTNFNTMERIKDNMVQYIEKAKGKKGKVGYKIKDYIKYNHSWRTMDQEQNYIKSLSPDDIRKMAQQLFKSDPIIFKMTNKNKEIPPRVNDSKDVIN